MLDELIGVLDLGGWGRVCVVLVVGLGRFSWEKVNLLKTFLSHQVIKSYV